MSQTYKKSKQHDCEFRLGPAKRIESSGNAQMGWDGLLETLRAGLPRKLWYLGTASPMFIDGIIRYV